MDIKGLNQYTQTNLIEQRKQPIISQEEGNTGPAPTVTTDNNEAVHLTDKAQKMQELQETIKQLPAIDTDKVAKLKAQIEKGEYEVDTEQVAAKIISFEQETA